MSPEFIGHIVRLVAIAMVGAMLLSGLRSIIAARRRVGSQEDILRLAEAVERLEDQVSEMRLQQAELAERVDFSERVLARATEAVPQSEIR